MRNLYYKFFCKLHFLAKLVLGKRYQKKYRFISFSINDFNESNEILIQGKFINEIILNSPKLINKNELFPIENAVEIGSNTQLKESFVSKKELSLSLGVQENEAKNVWQTFLQSSVIEKGYRYSGLLYTGFIASGINQWCLPSWLWTNSVTVRLYCKQGNIDKAESLGKLLLEKQLDCGGWIVRNDYNSRGSIPVLAPNDSAYIANNAFIELYKVTQKQEYLDVAIKCADWIMETAREDNLVWTGFDLKNKKWLKDYVIVDTGFTAGLFANLVEITKKDKYKLFLEKFVNQYVNLFYNESKNGFATSINSNNIKGGGIFTRGQAWALEGLIPSYKVLKSKKLEIIIEKTISKIIDSQSSNGGWAYNFSKPYLGQDCKGIAVVAKSILDWHNIKPNPKILKSSEKAIQWCLNHTANKGVSKGGIFSFCMEGAVVHNLYTSTAFVYTSAYAIEVLDMIKSNK